jgi:hypothetical protein
MEVQVARCDEGWWPGFRDRGDARYAIPRRSVPAGSRTHAESGCVSTQETFGQNYAVWTSSRLYQVARKYAEKVDSSGKEQPLRHSGHHWGGLHIIPVLQ